MKVSIIFSVLMIFLTGNINGQINVDSIDINKLDIAYCQITVINRGIWSKNKIVVAVDYGQENRKTSEQLIQKSDGQSLIFDYVIGVINFMDKNGWELYKSDILFIGDNCTFLMKRKDKHHKPIDNDDQNYSDVIPEHVF